jgi:hypothetical protein
MWNVRRTLLLATLALVCCLNASPAAAAPLDCSIATSRYWPDIKVSTACSGGNHLWAFNVCWKLDSAPTDWNVVCPASCSWRTWPSAGCVAETGGCVVLLRRAAECRAAALHSMLALHAAGLKASSQMVAPLLG